MAKDTREVDVIKGVPDRNESGNHHSSEIWERDSGDLPYYTKIKQMLELPGVDDLPGVALRSVLKDETMLNAAGFLVFYAEKYHIDWLKDMIRFKLAGSAGIGGLARLQALFAGTNLFAPDSHRIAMGLGPSKHSEKVHRSSDFREKDGQHIEE